MRVHAEKTLIVFDDNGKGKALTKKPAGSGTELLVVKNWDLELQHSNGSNQKMEMEGLKDLKDMPGYVSFSGTIIYRSTFNITDKNKTALLNLGKVYGISTLVINGKDLGVQWYGRRIYDLKGVLQNGINFIEIKVVTSMGNYMKSLKDNSIAQYWTNIGRKDQPLQSMGLTGPVTIA